MTVLALVLLACGSATPDVPTPTEPTAVGDYPGTYMGVCQRMEACGCAPRPTTEACAARAEEAIFSTRAIMAEAGNPIPEPTEEQLAGIANGDCTPLCAEIRASLGFEP